ncbi:aminoglycoside phosphotransferase family protein [Microbacterium sp. USHLN186]|uniref:aminoglycoside phosphotransferase family protein n=1 Tax=Microbacterium sp. USHLN186 TaxID=3081286 RepID=UPI003018272B
MTSWHGGRLQGSQVAWLQARLSEPALVGDLSWDLVESVVLHVRTTDGDVIVKAGGAANHHIGREIAAHAGWTAPLEATGHAARLRDSSVEERVMLLEYLPGALAEGTAAEWHPSTYAQAGALLRRLHAGEQRTDAGHERRANERALTWLAGVHRVDPASAARARGILLADPAPPVTVVPTHGDWQPRNWLVEYGTVRVIDFGRFAFRPAATDFTRLAAQQWRQDPDLEAAFLAGYGGDPRSSDRQRVDALREGIGTACWAFHVGDEDFEAQGHRMITEALDAF